MSESINPIRPFDPAKPTAKAGRLTFVLEKPIGDSMTANAGFAPAVRLQRALFTSRSGSSGVFLKSGASRR
jgi:hypothetical protein